MCLECDRIIFRATKEIHKLYQRITELENIIDKEKHMGNQE